MSVVPFRVIPVAWLNTYSRLACVVPSSADRLGPLQASAVPGGQKLVGNNREKSDVGGGGVGGPLEKLPEENPRLPVWTALTTKENGGRPGPPPTLVPPVRVCWRDGVA